MQVTLTAEGEPCSVILSDIHKSFGLVATQKSLKTTDVDRYLTAGPPRAVEAFIATLRKPWKASE